MGLLDKLKSIVIGNIGDKQPAAPRQQEPADNEVTPAKEKETPVVNVSSKNSINNQADLTKAIEKVLKGYYKGQKYSFEDKILNIWVNDTLQYDSLRASSFVVDLISSLDNEMGAVFSSVKLQPGPIPANNTFTKITDVVYIELTSKITVTHSGKAEISIIGNHGSLKQNVYQLDSVEIEKMPTRRYNIGIGEYPELANVYRHNHIAVDDDPQNPCFEKNKYVSRKHAYITYSANVGYLLQAEPEGTKIAGKRTRILRETGVIEVDDVVAQPLRNGDCIELSKNVRLLFKIIAE